MLRVGTHLKRSAFGFCELILYAVVTFGEAEPNYAKASMGMPQKCVQVQSLGIRLRQGRHLNGEGVMWIMDSVIQTKVCRFWGNYRLEMTYLFRFYCLN